MPYSKFTAVSKKLCAKSKSTYTSILKTPFVRGLIKGLAPEKFQYFTQQDIYYLEQSFQPGMEMLYRKATAPHHKKLFSSFIESTEKELKLLKNELRSHGAEQVIPASEITKAYGSHITASCEESYVKGVAASFACFLFFPAVGLHIKNQVVDISQHPQKAWIQTYSEDLFHTTNEMAELVNEVIKPEHEPMVIKTHMTSAAFEFKFFESALKKDDGSDEGRTFPQFQESCRL